MADLIIPAFLLNWLFFLIVFYALGYSPSFSILFGAIGGLSGGLVTAWWQVKGGVPASPEALRGQRRELREDTDDEAEATSRWELPFWQPNRPRDRYLERRRQARLRREGKPEGKRPR